MRLCLLGAVRLVVNGQERDLGPGKQQCVLAALLMTPGRTVPVETIIDRVWGERPPRSRNAVAPYVTRLRRIIDTGAPDGHGDRQGMVRYAAGGYLIDCDPNLVDLHRARRLAGVARAAREAGHDHRASELWRETLATWQPVALAGVPGQWAERTRDALARERLELFGQLAQADLRLGRLPDVVDSLRPLVAEHPTAESLVAALLVALAGTARSVEALECYARTRNAIVEELGIEPSQQLQDLYLRILRNDSDPINPQRLAGSDVGWPSTVPAQLPPDLVGFTGRGAELVRLDALVANADAREAPGRTGVPVGTPAWKAEVISVISGTAGAGKTALAVHWAHRVRDAFPDGQLYVNLRGFDPSGSAMSPTEALRGLLNTLGMAPQQIPTDLPAQTAVYRSLLAHRRLLILLDNARDPDQVRPLLPGSSGCLVVVTSRDPLTSLVAIEDAHPLTLDLLTTHEARTLLVRRVGPHRAAAEPQAVDEIVAACAQLPLALVVVAARAATRPQLPLSALAEELRGAREGLDAFDGGDAATDVRAVFSWSYNTLTVAAARLFRMLGLHCGPDIALPAAASLAGIRPRQAKLLLAELTRAHLMTEHAPGRYMCHDLLRAYAAQLAQADAGERRAATHRMLDHYLHTAHAADRLLEPQREQIVLPPPQPGVTPVRLDTLEQALSWLNTERAALIGAVYHAADNEMCTHTWQLALALTSFFQRRGPWTDQAATQHLALDLARRAGDKTGQAHMHQGIARANFLLGDYDEAYAHARQALDLHRELGNLVGEARAQCSIAVAHSRRGDLDQAAYHAEQSLNLFQKADHKQGQAQALNDIGWNHALCGRYQQALTFIWQALQMHQELAEPSETAQTWHSLGYAYYHLGRHHRATICYGHALDLFRQCGARYYEAETLHRLGDAHRSREDLTTATRAWQQALDILDELGHQDAVHVRAKLHDLRRRRLPDLRDGDPE